MVWNSIGTEACLSNRYKVGSIPIQIANTVVTAVPKK